MSEYLIKFARYRNGETRLSGAQFIRTKDGSFDQAVEIANDRIRGMIAADPDSRYYIERIELRGLSAHVDCESGGRMFETKEEFSERVAAGIPVPQA